MFEKILSIFSSCTNTSNFNALETQKRYKHLLFNICNGIHNYKDEIYFRNSNVKNEEYEENIRALFAYIRWIILDTDICSEEKYQNILHFIKNDFSDYFNGNSNEFNFEKFKNICEEN